MYQGAPADHLSALSHKMHEQFGVDQRCQAPQLISCLLDLVASCPPKDHKSIVNQQIQLG